MAAISLSLGKVLTFVFHDTRVRPRISSSLAAPGETSRATPARTSVRDELGRVLAESSSTDEFVHGLMGFLVELSREQSSHPVLAALGQELGRASTASFAAMAMHDVRSILQSVTMSLELAPVLLERSGLLRQSGGQRGGPGPDPERIGLFIEALEDAQLGARMATDLARETLALHRETGAQSTRINAVIEVAARLGQRLVPIELALETADSLEVRVDRAPLFRVLVNLIRNAAHAISELEEPDDARIIITSWASDELVFVQVADEGPGIPPGAREQIFDLFFTTHAEGTGIGLYLCKTLVASWGGRIYVDSPEGGGARFTFSVPRRMGESVPAGHRDGESAPMRR